MASNYIPIPKVCDLNIFSEIPWFFIGLSVAQLRRLFFEHISYSHTCIYLTFVKIKLREIQVLLSKANRFEIVSIPLLPPARVGDWSGEVPTDHLETLPQLPPIHENYQQEKRKDFFSFQMSNHIGEKPKCLSYHQYMKVEQTISRKKKGNLSLKIQWR